MLGIVCSARVAAFPCCGKPCHEATVGPAALAFVFRPGGNWFVAAWRHTVTPLGTALAWRLAAAVVAGYLACGSRRSAVIRSHAFRPRSCGARAGAPPLAIGIAVVTGFFEELGFRTARMDLALRAG